MFRRALLSCVLFAITIATTASATGVQDPRCAVRLLPQSVLHNEFADYVSNMALYLAHRSDMQVSELHPKPTPFSVTNELMLLAIEGKITVEIVENQTEPFRWKTFYGIQGRKAVTHFRSLLVSVDMAAEIAQFALTEKRPAVLSSQNIQAKSAEAWVEALSDAHFILAYGKNDANLGDLNLWNRAVQGKIWREALVEGRKIGAADLQLSNSKHEDIARALWPRMKEAFEGGKIDWFALNFGFETLGRLSANLEAKTPLDGVSFLADFAKSERGSSTLLQKDGLRELAMSEGDFREAFLNLGSKAAFLSAAVVVAENPVARSPKMKTVLEQAERDFEQAYHQIERWLGAKKSAGSPVIEVYTPEDASEYTRKNDRFKN